MATSVKAHVISLTVCLVLAVSGVGLIVAAVLTNGAEHGRFTQCFSSERMDLAVLHGGFPNIIEMTDLKPSTLAALRSIPGVDAVKEVRGGLVHLFGAASTEELEAVALPDGGLPMVPLVAGSLPLKPSQVVMYEQTAKQLGVRIGDTVTFASAKGDPVNLRVVGLINIDVDHELLTKGTIGLNTQTAAQLFEPMQLQGLQITLDARTNATATRTAVAKTLGSDYSVYTRQDIAAKRSIEAEILTIALSVLGLTCILAATFISCTTYGRVNESCLKPAGELVAEHGRKALRRLLIFDRFVGLVISTASGVAMAAGLLVLLASMGADLPCMNVMSMTGITVLIPLAAYAFAMSTAPLPSMLKRRPR